jgi:hypothetical protein
VRLTLALWLVVLAAGVAHGKPAKKSDVEQDTVAGGAHFRMKGQRGVVHVWVPEGYEPRNAGIVVYVHGYRSSADQSWRDYRLGQQFKASKQNAVFIVPDAPAGNDDGLHYDRLTDLLRLVWRKTRVDRPWGAIVVIGHSGAFRTIVPWLDYTAIDHVILLDALYAAESRFSGWLNSAKGHASNKITIVGQDTSGRAQAFLRQFKQVVRMARVPGSFAELDRRQRTARVLYMQSQYGHMQLVASGKVIPLLLRRTPLKPIGTPLEAPYVWKDPHPFHR